MDTHLPKFPKLFGDIQADVLVIGGGMAGLLTAYLLHQKGVDTVVVEKDRICSATTAGTTAKITAQHGLIYRKILKSYSEEYAQMYYMANSEAVRHLKALCREADCPLEIKDNFVYSSDKKLLEAEFAALQRIGVAAIYEESLPLPVATAGGVGLADQAQFHPLQLARFLASDLTIYENTKVREMIGTTAVTDSGMVKAEKVVVATHFPFINKHGSYFLKLYQHRSYMIALKDAAPFKAMYVDDSKTGFSFSSFDGVFLLGGGGHRTGKQGGSYRTLRELKNKYYPNCEEICSWAAQDTMSLDGIPYIGSYSKRTPYLYVAAGFNKWGMTGTMVSAQIITDALTGERMDYAPVFSPERSILKPQLAINGFEATKNMLIPTTRRCPHLGCALKYNKEERSWDCACHGSRFSESGKVLNNPANGDLKN